MLIEETDWYTIGLRDQEIVKRTHTLFTDDLKIYQESHRKLEVMKKNFHESQQKLERFTELRNVQRLFLEKVN